MVDIRLLHSPEFPPAPCQVTGRETNNNTNNTLLAYGGIVILKVDMCVDKSTIMFIFTYWSSGKKR